MKGWAWLMVFALAVPGLAGAEKKDKDKGKGKEQAKVEVRLSAGEQAVKQAEDKIRAGQTTEALGILRQATQVEGMTGEPFMRLAQLLENTAEVDTAVTAYKTAAERLSGPGKGEALARLALVQETTGALSEAQASSEAAQAADPEGAWPALALARTRARQNKGDEALALAEKAVANGGGAAARTSLAFAQEARGDLAAAEAAYREALAAEPGRVAADLGLARVLRKTGRAAEADPLLTSALDKTPWLVEAYKEAVLTKIALEQFVSALEQATTAAAINDKDPEAQKLVQQVVVARALDYVAKKQPDLAIEDLVKARDENPQAVAVRVGLGQAYLAKRQLDLAQAELAKAIELDPNSAEAHFHMGVLQHEGRNAAAAALTEYEKAAALDPENVEYRIRFGNVLSAQNQGNRAIAELRKVVDGKGASRADAWTYLGGAYLQAARYQEATTALAKALELLPDVEQNRPARGLASRYMAWAYLNLKDKDNFLKYGTLARDLGAKTSDPALMERLAGIERGEGFAGAATAKPTTRRPARRR
jgi:tetratricopeptide (TPR) repeat protein